MTEAYGGIVQNQALLTLCSVVLNLATVSHNGMKDGYNVEVCHGKKMLLKSCLIGTNSTLSMLKKVFLVYNTAVFGTA